MGRIRRSISGKRAAFSRILPPRFKNWAVCLYVWTATSETSGGARAVCSGVGRRIVSSSFSNTVGPAASKALPLFSRALLPTASQILRHRRTSCTMQSFARTSTGPAPLSRLLKHQRVVPLRWLRWLKRISTTCGPAAKNTLDRNSGSMQLCRMPFGDIKQFRILAVIRTQASPHAFVEITDTCQFLRWYQKASYYLA